MREEPDYFLFADKPYSDAEKAAKRNPSWVKTLRFSAASSLLFPPISA
jgi:hypothetical protein